MIFIKLFQNLLLIFGLAFLHHFFVHDMSNMNLRNKLLSGFLFGTVGIIGMFMPYQFADGIIFDTRTVILSTAGFFSGPVSAIIAALMCILFRINIGGSGLIAGVAIIIASAAVGVMFFYIRKKLKHKEGFLLFFTFGIIVHFVMLIMLALFLPESIRNDTLRIITPFLVTLYPVATMSLCIIFVHQEKHIKAENNFRTRIEFEKTISEISAKFINIESNNIDDEIEKTLEILGRLTGVDRSYVALIDNANKSVSYTHEWYRETLSPIKQLLQDLPVSDFPWWMEKLEKDKIIHFSSINEIPDTADEEKKILIRLGLFSVVAVAMHYNKQLIGFVGFVTDKTQKQWLNEDIDLLKVISNIYSSAIMRIRLNKEKNILEKQLYQAGKIESVGRLAGGIAHDFNNLLSVIIGYSEVAMQELESSNPVISDIEEILKAAKKSSALTSQLLAFARKQEVNPKILNINDVIENIFKMLKRLIGEDIKLTWRPCNDQCSVNMDPSQLDQILTNLCINARDAIENTGEIMIETAHKKLNKEFCESIQECFSGDFCFLSVSDNGCGMDKETQTAIFEPYFTTKEYGKGTGLGLSTVYGIVKQNNGYIDVSSTPGHGTTFKLYIPSHIGETDFAKIYINDKKITDAEETILIVEDDPAIINIANRILKKQGYNILSTTSTENALFLAKEHRGEIKLLITDVIMPGLNGKDLAYKLSSICPDIKTLFMSGYTSNIIAQRGIIADGVNFIQKPFSVDELSNKVRNILDNK